MNVQLIEFLLGTFFVISAFDMNFVRQPDNSTRPAFTFRWVPFIGGLILLVLAYMQGVRFI